MARSSDRAKRKPAPWTVVASSLVFGLVMAGAGWLFGRSVSAREGDEIVTGVIVEVIETRDTDGDRVYRPVVAYTDRASDRTYEIERSYSSSSRPTIGDEVEVAFPPDDPADGRVLSTGIRYLSGALVVIGLLAVGFALVQAARALVRGVRGDPDTVGAPVVEFGDRPAGWYDDPDDGREDLRWWDGQRWTANWAGASLAED